MRSDRIDHFTYLFGRSLLIGVDRPEIQLLQIVIAGKIRERSFAGDQPTFIGRDFCQRGMERGQRLVNLRFITFGIFLVNRGVIRIVFRQRVANIVDVDHRVFRRHPGVRVGFPVIRSFADAHGFHPVRNRHFRHTRQILVEAGKPQLQIQTVREDQLRPLRSLNVARSGLILMNFRAGFGDRTDVGRLTRHVLRHVRNDREGGNDIELLFGISR
ncbi:hypothetical protein SDC9_137194 [bioreactor metagenome]|uniref:Uncharacterized protein n=1 Tax=bioreactor metagenome TaxID=1076179 RepID=A0A645DLX3_9ZZZZ